MENVLQELDAVVKDEFAPLPFVISQKVKSLAKKPMINQQVSLANQVLKNPKINNAQHVSKIVEFDYFYTEETEVAERQPLKRLKKTLLLLEASEEENKQSIKTHEEDNQSSPKKNTVIDQQRSKNNKKNLSISNVVQKLNVTTKKGETSQTTYKNILCIRLHARIITKYTLNKVWIHYQQFKHMHRPPKKMKHDIHMNKTVNLTFKLDIQICISTRLIK